MSDPLYFNRQTAYSEDRRREVVRLRAEGKTYREIAEMLGVSIGRAQQLGAYDDKHDREAGGFLGPGERLPTRVINALRIAGYATLGEAAALSDAGLLAIKNVGKKGLAAIREAKR